MNRLRLWISLVGLMVGSLPAAELIPGLAYLRPGAEVTSETGSTVLDLRYVTDEAAAAPLLAAVQPGNANERRVILALLSPETPAGVTSQLTRLPRCLTIGHAAPDFKTDIVVAISAEADRRAFDTLVAGTPPDKLLGENADKVRYDESALVREHAGVAAPVDVTESAPSATPEPAASTESPTKSDASVAAAAKVDAVLQRAVHIHRGLLILKKL